MEKWPRQGGDGAKIVPHGSNRGQWYFKTNDGIALQDYRGHPHRRKALPATYRRALWAKLRQSKSGAGRADGLLRPSPTSVSAKILNRFLKSELIRPEQYCSSRAIHYLHNPDVQDSATTPAGLPNRLPGPPLVILPAAVCGIELAKVQIGIRMMVKNGTPRPQSITTASPAAGAGARRRSQTKGITASDRIMINLKSST